MSRATLGRDNSVPMTPKLLLLGDGALSPALQPLELPGKQGGAETLLQHEQTAQGRLRPEHKTPSEMVFPLSPGWVLALPSFWCKIKQVT